MDRVIREISRTLLKPGPEITDGQLLEMFRVRRDELAFEAIVQRHGPMVLAVCHRILRNRHDAEDAFQATFLVLARKSGSISRQHLIANWLYGVAVRTSRKLRSQGVRSRLRERLVASAADVRMEAHESDFDLRESLDRELARLPAKYRTPIVLCELEGKSHKEAARELRWPEGTLSVRLMRAKKLLAKRLARQGLAPTAGAITIVSASASVPSALASSSVSFASLFAADRAGAAIPGSISCLAEGVSRAMFMSKMKTLVASFLLLGVLVGGVAYSTRAMSAVSQAAKPANDAVAAAQEQEAPKKEKVDVPQPAPYRVGPGDTLGIWVEGILGEKGQPIPVTPRVGGDNALGPAIGYPIVVAEDGTIDLPFVKPISVAKKTLHEVREVIKNTYIEVKVLRADQDRILVSLIRSARKELVVAEAQGHIRDLRKARVDALKKATDSLVGDFMTGRMTRTEPLILSASKLLSAELELADNHRERLAAYDRALALAKSYQKSVVERFAVGTVGPTEHYSLLAHRLEIEIGYEREKLKGETPSK